MKQGTHLALDLVRLRAELLDLAVVVAPLDGHLLVLALQALERLLAREALVFGVPLGALKLLVGVRKLLVYALYIPDGLSFVERMWRMGVSHLASHDELCALAFLAVEGILEVCELFLRRIERAHLLLNNLQLFYTRADVLPRRQDLAVHSGEGDAPSRC